jgi:hypothetical protein
VDGFCLGTYSQPQLVRSLLLLLAARHVAGCTRRRRLLRIVEGLGPQAAGATAGAAGRGSRQRIWRAVECPLAACCKRLRCGLQQGARQNTGEGGWQLAIQLGSSEGGSSRVWHEELCHWQTQRRAMARGGA